MNNRAPSAPLRPRGLGMNHRQKGTQVSHTTRSARKPLLRLVARFASLRGGGSGARSSEVGVGGSTASLRAKGSGAPALRPAGLLAALALAVLTNVRLRVAGADRTKIRLLAPLCLTALLALAASSATAAPPAEFGSEGSNPRGVAVDHEGSIYVADNGAPA